MRYKLVKYNAITNRCTLACLCDSCLVHVPENWVVGVRSHGYGDFFFATYYIHHVAMVYNCLPMDVDLAKGLGFKKIVESEPGSERNYKVYLTDKGREDYMALRVAKELENSNRKGGE